MNLTIGLLCSGELGLNTLKALSNYFTPQFIFTNKYSVGIIDFAKNNNIPVFIGNPRKKDPSLFLKQFKTDVIFSINYIFIVEENLLNHPSFYSVNLHGSLLPKYRGRTPHVWAIINGEKETGVTAHLMEDRCDTGDIILQKKIKIRKSFTGADVINVFKNIYPDIILELIEQIETGRIQQKKQDNSKATYFGRRTPEDGQIDWNWQKERIYNWVRAQAFPYPGAFSYINGEKMIIDKIKFSDYGFKDSIPNGQVIKVKPEVLVKTPNGVVELVDVRNSDTIPLEGNNKFDSP